MKDRMRAGRLRLIYKASGALFTWTLGNNFGQPDGFTRAAVPGKTYCKLRSLLTMKMKNLFIREHVGRKISRARARLRSKKYRHWSLAVFTGAFEFLMVKILTSLINDWANNRR